MRRASIGVLGWRARAPGAIEQDALIALADVRTEHCANILLDQWHGALSQELSRSSRRCAAG